MIVVGSTLAAYKAEDENGAMSWLWSADRMDGAGHEIKWFAALEVHRDGWGSGSDPIEYDNIREKLTQLGGGWWNFQIDDFMPYLTTRNRLVRICTGRNLIAEYAVRVGADWILHLDSDIKIHGDALAKLLEVDWPIVGGDVPNYVMSGPAVPGRPCRACDPAGHVHPFGFPVEEHWNTAGFLLVSREVFRSVRWRWDPDADMSDDPCYAHDVHRMLGYKTLVRKDVIGHHAVPLLPLEERGHDLRL